MTSLHEGRKRSLTKAILWRVIATGITLAVAYAHTGLLDQSLKITIAIAIISTIGYYIHERVWSHVEWGNGS
ncbi:MAG: DUF2061 domain-containing protein [Patescibacteria group bacterium]